MEEGDLINFKRANITSYHANQGGDFEHVFKCDHEALKRKKKGEPSRPKLKVEINETHR